MKRILLLMFVLASAGFGQPRTQMLVNQWLAKPVVYAYTVAGLPTSGGGLTVGAIAVVNNSLTAGSCTVGGGSAVALCRWSGSVWVSLGGAAGSADAITQTAAYDALNAVSVSAAASGRAVVQTPLRVDPTTGAITNSSTDPTSMEYKWQTGTLPAGASGKTNTGMNTAGVPVWRAAGGSEKTVASTDEFIEPIGCAIGDPVGSALATGVLCYVTAANACTIMSWDILVNSGTATVGIWKIATGTAIPTVANSIVASAPPAIASGTAIHSTSMSGWTTAVAQHDIFGFNLTTTSGPKYIYVGVNCGK